MILVDEDCSLYKPSKLSMLMDGVCVASCFDISPAQLKTDRDLCGGAADTGAYK